MEKPRFRAPVDFTQMLGDGDSNVRIAAAEVLRDMGPAAAAAAPALVRMLDGESHCDYYAHCLAEALEKIGVAASTPAPALNRRSVIIPESGDLNATSDESMR